MLSEALLSSTFSLRNKKTYLSQSPAYLELFSRAYLHSEKSITKKKKKNENEKKKKMKILSKSPS